MSNMIVSILSVLFC